MVILDGSLKKNVFLGKININSQTALVWWLILYAPNAVAWVQSLVGRLRSDMPHGMAKKTKKKNKIVYEFPD